MRFYNIIIENPKKKQTLFSISFEDEELESNYIKFTANFIKNAKLCLLILIFFVYCINIYFAYTSHGKTETFLIILSLCIIFHLIASLLNYFHTNYTVKVVFAYFQLVIFFIAFQYNFFIINNSNELKYRESSLIRMLYIYLILLFLIYSIMIRPSRLIFYFCLLFTIGILIMASLDKKQENKLYIYPK
jgi:hypothetical protein